VFVEPPMAMSSVMAFSRLEGRDATRENALVPFDVAPARKVDDTRPAASKSCHRMACVPATVPLPGSAKPRASLRQFMLLAVNMPEQRAARRAAERSSCSN